jgi:hypothetical protein
VDSNQRAEMPVALYPTSEHILQDVHIAIGHLIGIGSVPISGKAVYILMSARYQCYLRRPNRPSWPAAIIGADRIGTDRARAARRGRQLALLAASVIRRASASRSLVPSEAQKPFRRRGAHARQDT